MKGHVGIAKVKKQTLRNKIGMGTLKQNSTNQKLINLLLFANTLLLDFGICVPLYYFIFFHMFSDCWNSNIKQKKVSDCIFI